MTAPTTVDADGDAEVDYEALANGRKHRFAYRVARAADGADVTIPVTVIAGDSPGPRVVCVAGIHGDEPEGVTALHELGQELDPSALSGTLVLVHCANPPAFRARTRRTPEDDLDMNRAFPGDRDGTVTERLAHHLLHDIAADADLVVSMHSFGNGSLTVPYVEFGRDSAVARESQTAAEAFGTEYVDAFEWPDGVFSKACTERGIPAIEPEIGGLGVSVPKRRAQYVDGVRNVLRHLDMLPGTPDAAEEVTLIDRHKVTAPVEGVLTHHHELGDGVDGDETIATIRALDGERVATLDAPTDGIVGGQRLSGTVHAGEQAVVVFSPKE